MQKPAKTEIIAKTLIDKIKDVEPNLAKIITTSLENRNDFTSVKACEKIVRSEFMSITPDGAHTIGYWLSRGWSTVQAEIRSKEKMREQKIWESEFKQNREETIQKCINFLTQ